MIERLQRFFLSLLIRHYLAEFTVTKRQMTDGEYSSAMRDLATSSSLQTHLNLTIANLIRGSLYVTDMEKHAYYRGQIAALRKLQTDAQRWEQSMSVHDEQKKT